MRRCCIVLVLLAAACAAPPPPRPEIRIRPLTPDPSAFEVAESGGEPETRRYRIKPEEYFDDVSDGQGRVDFHDYQGKPAALIQSVDRATAAALHAARVIRALIAPGTWDQDARRALYVDHDELVVRHAPAVLDRIDRLIDTLKSSRQTMVRCRAKIFSIQQGLLATIENLAPIEGGLAGLFQGEALRALVSKVSTGLWSPDCTMFTGQESYLMIRESTPYIEGYEVGENGWTPKVSVLVSGMTIHMRGVPNGPGSETIFIDVNLEARESRAVRAVTLGAGPLQMPVAATVRIGGRFVIAQGQALLFVLQPLRSDPGPLVAVALEAELEPLREKSK
ncbi:MAG TPA: hypothetical protein VK661_05420 [Planctomycetota bacterium]|nr:hypothetical protein [Planctomycetota bacterium]